MTGPLRNVLIVGGGIEAATVAIALRRALPTEIDVLLLRADEDPLIPAVVASLPGIRLFHADAGVDEAALLRAGIASFSLGTAMSGWTATGEASFAPFGDVGAMIEGVPFHQHVARLRAAGHQLRPTNYSVATLMAQASRFAHPSNDPASPLSTFSYALHLERDAYAAHLLGEAVQARLKIVPGVFGRVRCDEESFARVETDRGEEIQADLIIDATGGAARIIGSLPDRERHDWGACLPVDRLLTWTWNEHAEPLPYDHLAAHPAGWQRSLSGAARVAELFGYSSKHLPDSEAVQITNAPGAHPVAFYPGREAQPWRGNVIAVGNAAAIIEPGACLGLELLHNQIRRLLRLFPASLALAVERQEYVRESGAELDRARDVSLVGYILSGRSGQPFWDDAGTISQPAELAAKIALFQSCGRVPLLDGDDLAEAEWATMFENLGLRQERHAALAEAVSVERMTAMLARMREAMIRAIAPLPRHGAYLASFSGRVAAA